MEAQRRAGRPQLKRKLRDLIGHPSTEPFIRAEARRKYALLFPHDVASEPLPRDTEAFIIIERRLYAFPRRLWAEPFLFVGAGFRRRAVTYGEILAAAGDAEFVGFYQVGRAILIEFAGLVSQETVATCFAAHGLDCTVRHLHGFIGSCQYQVRFPASETLSDRSWRSWV